MNEEIKAIILRILHENAETGVSFLLAKMETPNGLVSCRINALGRWFVPGAFVWAHGQWHQQKNQEKVFRARAIFPIVPTRADSIEFFLSTILTQERHGISSVELKNLINKHGVRALFGGAAMNPEIFCDASLEPEKYRSVITSDIEFYKDLEKTYAAMRNAGISYSLATAILNRVTRERRLALVVENPWALSRPIGAPLSEMDKIAHYFGFDVGDTKRTNAVVIRLLHEEAGNGSTIIRKSDAYPLLVHEAGNNEAAIIKYFVGGHHSSEVSMIEARGENGEAEEFISLSKLFKAEKDIYEFVSRTHWRNSHQRSANRASASKILALPEFKFFDETQRSAVLLAAEEPFLVITGGPGTGKSTILRAVARACHAIDPNNILLAAPTGKAAKRLSETTGRPALTVHRLLRARRAENDDEGVFSINENNPLPSRSVVIIDEASMLDSEMAAGIIRAIPENGRLILVGDKNQLMSVGAGNVLDDILSGQGLAAPPSAELINVYRQDKDGSIALGAAKIREGEIPNLGESSDVSFTQAEDRDIATNIENIVTGLIEDKRVPAKDIAILSPMMAGFGGVAELNARLSRIFNPSGEDIPNFLSKLKDGSEKIQMRVGDRVMSIANDFDNDIVNGDTGVITGFEVNQSNRPVIEVSFHHGKVLKYFMNKWKTLIPAYCMSIHKSQGSQYPVVIVAVADNHKKMLERRLIYTAWTRASSRLILVGSQKAFEESLKNLGKPRQTALRKIFLEGEQKWASYKEDIGKTLEYNPLSLRGSDFWKNKEKTAQEDWCQNAEAAPPSLLPFRRHIKQKQKDEQPKKNIVERHIERLLFSPAPALMENTKEKTAPNMSATAFAPAQRYSSQTLRRINQALEKHTEIDSTAALENNMDEEVSETGFKMS